jgi:hypothetical protein
LKIDFILESMPFENNIDFIEPENHNEEIISTSLKKIKIY